jgi:hypothetical protein
MIQLLTAHEVPESSIRDLEAFPGAGICLESMDRYARAAHAALIRRSSTTLAASADDWAKPSQGPDGRFIKTLLCRHNLEWK